MSEEEILSGLKEQKVSKVIILKRRVNDQLVSTWTAIVSVTQTTVLPRSVDFGLYPVLVDLCIPKPMRCTVCLRLGHTKKWCKGERVCANCSMPEHTGECPFIKCVPCEGNHNTLSKDCPAYIDEAENQKIKTVDRVTYAEARIIRRRQCPPIPRVLTTDQSFADKTKTKRYDPAVEKILKQEKTPRQIRTLKPTNAVKGKALPQPI